MFEQFNTFISFLKNVEQNVIILLIGETRSKILKGRIIPTNFYV